MAEGHSAAKDAFSWWSNKNSQSLNKWRGPFNRNSWGTDLRTRKRPFLQSEKLYPMQLFVAGRIHWISCLYHHKQEAVCIVKLQVTQPVPVSVPLYFISQFYHKQTCSLQLPINFILKTLQNKTPCTLILMYSLSTRSSLQGLQLLSSKVPGDKLSLFYRRNRGTD